MNRAAPLVAAAAIAVLGTGCRALIEIEELTVVTDASTTESGADGGADASSSDTGTPDGPPSGPGGDASACATKGNECSRCCKESFPGEAPRLEQQLIATGCICGPGQCSVQCATTLCAPTPISPSPECAPCVDLVLVSPNPSPQCKQALDNCGMNPQNNCAGVVGCMMKFCK